MTTSTLQPNQRDLEHLRVLAIFHWIYAAIVALFSMVPLVHIALGLGMAAASGHQGVGTQSDANALRTVGALFVAFGSCFIVCGLGFAICIAWSGRCLSRRTNRTFCFVVACVLCLAIPLGTVLGVFTLLTLSRDSVREAFGGSA